MRYTLISILLYICELLPMTPHADIASTYAPQDTSIAVLPSVNTTTDKWKQLIHWEAEYARKRVYKMFSTRGFKSIQPFIVDDSVTKLNININDEYQWTLTSFEDIGNASGADLVAFVLIKQVQFNLFK